jgi:hypothetical protein
MSDEEYAALEQAARVKKLPIGKFVRQELRRSCADSGARSVEEIERVLAKFSDYKFPAPPIDQMNEEIEMGYRLGLPRRTLASRPATRSISPS